jgi:hypothetical protein
VLGEVFVVLGPSRAALKLSRVEFQVLGFKLQVGQSLVGANILKMVAA